MVDIAKLAKTVDDAAHKARAIAQLSDKTKYTLDEAYEIQSASIQRRLSRGEKRNGMKMGFTSRAKMIQMGLNDMIWGRLTDHMMVEDGDTISWGAAEFIAGEEMGRTRGFWWAPDSQRLLVERVDVAPIDTWWIAAPVTPAQAPRPIRYPGAGTPNARSRSPSSDSTASDTLLSGI